MVDTFGAMYPSELDRIVSVLDSRLDPSVELGLHAHNNQQLAFALCIHFIEILKDKRNIIVDATLSGMGRGAGNATTELVAGYLNKSLNRGYDLNAIMDAIDMYIKSIREKFSWGYSTEYFISGLYQCHVNNISYLNYNHRINARDLRTIIESLSVDERRKYDYDILEQKYIENQSRYVDDSETTETIRTLIGSRKVLLIAPGRSSLDLKEKIKKFIDDASPVVIEVNSINKIYTPDYLFISNSVRYDYAKRIILSNIHTVSENEEYIFNYNLVIQRGWDHYDNAVILALRLLNRIGVKDVYIAGFDGFKEDYDDSYADISLPNLNPENKWVELNDEIGSMFRELADSLKGRMNISFLTPSIYEEK